MAAHEQISTYRLALIEADAARPDLRTKLTTSTCLGDGYDARKLNPLHPIFRLAWLFLLAFRNAHQVCK